MSSCEALPWCILKPLVILLQAIPAAVKGIVHTDWHLFCCQLPLLVQAVLEPHC